TSISATIDLEIQKKLDAQKIPASPLADDAEFLRRAYLDLNGRIPKIEETNAFLASTETDKRAKLIDQLLEQPEYGRHFATIWRDLMVDRTNEMGQVRQGFSWEFIDWAAGSFNKGRGWNEIVTDMLTAAGEAKTNPASTFVLANRMNEFPRPENLVGSASKLFMGVALRCAQCHDHPYVKEWKQDDFWGVAAFFGQLRDVTTDSNGGSQKPTLSESPNTDEKKETNYINRLKRQGMIPPMKGPQIAIPTIMDPTATLRVVQAKYFLSNAPKLDEKGPYRANFAEWLTGKENPYFARAAVNRWWAHFFAQGIVNPVDDMGTNHQPSHPELLALLEKEFKASNYDLKHLIRCISNSKTYQRTSRPLPENKQDTKLFSHMVLKQLSADQMHDSLFVTIGRAPTLGKNRDQQTAIFATKDADDNPTELSHGIPQFLNQMNASVARDNYVANRYITGKSKEDAVKNLYLGILSRPPKPQELEKMLAYLGKAANVQEGYRDVFWVLLNSAEFMFNH
ncbi:MAG: DUF1549 and DUF1553 domain-containing protein, partial [Planctomycetes bacterium]|nr:DUF1549 and DUF1553 domain-containing protein [Planctomycetota bacterium]